MTKEKILAMKPGKQLDVLIAERIMAWESHPSLFNPSTDISASWEVVEKVKNKSLSQRRKFSNLLQEIVSQSVDLPKGTVINWSDMLFWITPEMICKATLLTELKEA